MIRHADGPILFSPTDLTEFVACDHLTQLSLAAALGERPRPFSRDAYRRAHPAQGRRSTRRAFSTRCATRARWWSRSGSGAPPDFAAGAGRPARRWRPARRTSTRPSPLGAAGAGSRTSSSGWSGPPRSARGATRCSTRSWPGTRGRSTRSSSASTVRRSAEIQELDARARLCRARNQRARRRSGSRTSPPTIVACGADSDGGRGRPPDDHAYPCEHCLLCNFHARL